MNRQKQRPHTKALLSLIVSTLSRSDVGHTRWVIISGLSLRSAISAELVAVDIADAREHALDAGSVGDGEFAVLISVEGDDLSL